MPMQSASSVGVSELTVLVVEDHEFQRRSLCRLLHRAGVEKVLEAEDGQSALALLNSCNGRTILVITDLDMPNVDGIEFIRHLATEFPAANVAIYSAQDPNLLRSVRMLAEELGLAFAGVLPKPANLSQIRALLEGVQPAKPISRFDVVPPLTVDEVREAFANDWVVSYFQPKVSLVTGETVGCEALVRIVHPSLGAIAPARFLSALEAAGLQRELTYRMLSGASALLREVDALCPRLSVSVNLTLPEVSEKQDAERLAAAVHVQSVAPERVVFEVTETAVATDWRLAVENLSRLRLKGFTLSVDDFGTGYSSLQQLLRLPFSELKLDRSFISEIGTVPAAHAVVEGTIRIAKKMGLTTVAEGIETASEAQMLASLDCDVGQGYAFSRPLPLADIVSWLRRSAVRQAPLCA